MKNIRILFVSILIVLPFSGKAQPSALPLGNDAVYYRIVNIKYPTQCIQYNHDAPSSAYKYMVANYDKQDLFQEWKMIPANNGDSTAFYLENRKNFLYLTATVTSLSTSRGTYLPLTRGTGVQSSATVWNFTPITSGIFLISGEDDNGIRRYLNACDSTTYAPVLVNPTTAARTAFAWKVIGSEEDPTGLSSIEASPAITVLDHRIIVSGVSSFRLYDLSGRIVSQRESLPAGIYIVSAGHHYYKVIIK